MTGQLTGVRDLATLPKAHLHLHLEGAMRPATLAELAGMAPPPTGAHLSFREFLALYAVAADLVRTPDELRRLVCEVVEDAAAKPGTPTPAWCPSGWPPTSR